MNWCWCIAGEDAKEKFEMLICLLYRPEDDTKPWEILLGELKEGNKRTTWLNRKPYAYWKGNPAVAETRQHEMQCF